MGSVTQLTTRCILVRVETDKILLTVLMLELGFLTLALQYACCYWMSCIYCSSLWNLISSVFNTLILKCYLLAFICTQNWH